MPNKNYIKGRRKEYKIVHDYRNREYVAFRSAGSHSPFDVVAINENKRDIRLIQAKPDTMSPKAKERLENELSRFNGVYTVRVVVE